MLNEKSVARRLLERGKKKKKLNSRWWARKVREKFRFHLAEGRVENEEGVRSEHEKKKTAPVSGRLRAGGGKYVKTQLDLFKRPRGATETSPRDSDWFAG